jgi:hypothetical protein
MIRWNTLVALLLGLSFQTATLMAQNTADTGTVSHREQIMQWRANRDASLRRENGWLSLVGLEWLQSGSNSLGSAAENSIHIPGGPAHWGDIVLTDQGLVFTPHPGVGVLVDGVEVEKANLLADDIETPTLVSHDSISFHVLFRESYGLRISDSQASTRLDFQGVENFDIQDQWLVDGQFVAAEAGKTMEIGNVLGQLLEMPVYGYLVFDSHGKTHRLAAIGDDESDTLWLIFADRTSGRETYGAGRFLYSDGMPVNGRLTVDFNKAYNPPCAFNDYSTCPLPPLENRLDLEVTAGEKNFHADSTRQ